MNFPESATVIVLPIFAAALAACTPSPQDNAMRSPSPASGINRGSREQGAEGAAKATGGAAGDQQRAALGPSPEPVSAASNPLPPRPADSPAAAQGRKTLSTAFVRIGPDGELTVELRNGRTVVLRDVVMRPKDYCGVPVPGPADARFCGGYADVASARPGR